VIDSYKKPIVRNSVDWRVVPLAEIEVAAPSSVEGMSEYENVLEQMGINYTEAYGISKIHDAIRSVIRASPLTVELFLDRKISR
jgi:hypothetical protein